MDRQSIWISSPVEMFKGELRRIHNAGLQKEIIFGKCFLSLFNAWQVKSLSFLLFINTLLELFKRWPWFWWENVIGNKVIVPSQPRPLESSKVKIAKRRKLDLGWLHSHCNLWCTSAQSQQRRLFSFSSPFLLSFTIPSRIKITFWHHHCNCHRWHNEKYD